MTSSASYSPDPSYATAVMTPRSGSPANSVTSNSATETHPDVPETIADQTLKPGIYRILNDTNPRCAIDLSGYDSKTIIAYETHEGDNQKWEFARLGPGYSIRSRINGSYITLESGIGDGGTMIATPYPVSWAVEADDFEAGIWKIRWPNSPFLFDFPGGKGHKVQLSNRYPYQSTRLWRLVPVKVDPHSHAPVNRNQLQFVTSAPRHEEPTPRLKTNADTVIDVEGLALGGNGEMSITTTTTTVTTSVTKVKRIGPL